VLVNNADVLRDSTLWKTSDEDFDAVIATHLSLGDRVLWFRPRRRALARGQFADECARTAVTAGGRLGEPTRRLDTAVTNCLHVLAGESPGDRRTSQMHDRVDPGQQVGGRPPRIPLALVLSCGPPNQSDHPMATSA
jgi:hypothetical protein